MHFNFGRAFKCHISVTSFSGTGMSYVLCMLRYTVLCAVFYHFKMYKVYNYMTMGEMAEPTYGY